MSTTSLRGQLNDGVIANLLQYLGMSSATGCLQLRHPELGLGKIYVKTGRVVHADYNRVLGIQAVSHFLTWHEGSFVFQTGEECSHESIRLSLDSLLLEAAVNADNAALDFSAAINADTVLVSVPVDDHITTIELTLKALHLLRYIDGKRSLKQIAPLLKWPLDDVITTAKQLAKQSTVEVPKKALADPKLIAEFVLIATELMGPMAEIVIDDCLYDLGLDAKLLPQDAVPELVEEIKRQLKRNDWMRAFEHQARQVCKRFDITW